MVLNRFCTTILWDHRRVKGLLHVSCGALLMVTPPLMSGMAALAYGMKAATAAQSGNSVLTARSRRSDRRGAAPTIRMSPSQRNHRTA